MIKLIQLPKDAELTIMLLREELRTNKLFTILATAGFEDCAYRSYLESAILTCAGFSECPDDLMQFLLDLIDRYTARITDPKQIDTVAMEVYIELMKEKERHVSC